MANVYASSGDDAKAAHYLTSALGQLWSLPQPSRAEVRDEIASVLTLSRSHANSEQKDLALEALRKSLRKRRARPLDPVSQLELLVALAALGETNVGQDADSPAVATEIERLHMRLPGALAASAITRADYVRGLHCVSDYLRTAGQPAAAVTALKPLLSLDGPTRLEVWKAIAAVYRHASQSKREIEALQKAGELAATIFRGGSVHSFEQIEVERLLAEALLRDNRREAAIAKFAEARRDYTELLRIMAEISRESRASEGAVRSRPVLKMAVAELVVRQRLAGVLLGMLKTPGIADPQLAAETVKAHVRLRDDYVGNLLPEDPRIAPAHMTLGELYLESGASPQALTELKRANDAMSASPSGKHLMRTVTLSLLAEASLAENQRTANVDQYLREAESICRQFLPEDELRWWIQLSRGQLATMRGKFQEAKQIFAAIPNNVESRSFSNKLRSSIALKESLLYKQRLDFATAEKLCRTALEIRQQELGEWHANLLPHYSALAALYIALRQPDKLIEVVARSNKICEQLPKNHVLALNVRHAEAMISFFRYEQLIRDQKQGRAELSHYKQAVSLWQSLLQDCPTAGSSAIRPRASSTGPAGISEVVQRDERSQRGIGESDIGPCRAIW